MSRGRPSLEAQFWQKVDKTPTCWLWIGERTSCGYGSFRRFGKGRTRRAHRIAFELTVGPIRDGLILDHKCRNILCVNPDHLRPVTQKQNQEHRGAGLNNSTGVLGVSRREYGTYSARVKHNGREVHGGTYRTLEEAAEAARQLRLSLFTHNDTDRSSS